MRLWESVRIQLRSEEGWGPSLGSHGSRVRGEGRAHPGCCMDEERSCWGVSPATGTARSVTGGEVQVGSQGDQPGKDIGHPGQI